MTKLLSLVVLVAFANGALAKGSRFENTVYMAERVTHFVGERFSTSACSVRTEAIPGGLRVHFTKNGASSTFEIPTSSPVFESFDKEDFLDEYTFMFTVENGPTVTLDHSGYMKRDIFQITQGGPELSCELKL